MLLSVLIPVYNERFRVRECVRQVLAAPLPEGVDREIIIVDDGSKDGTRDLLATVAAEHANELRLILHEVNQGKGAAIRTAIRAASGDIMLIQDSDLEYDPREYPKLLAPILDGEADAVYGSRFLPADRRRVLYYWHTLGNQGLTMLSNMFTNLNLTDMETCYKAVLSPFIKQLPIRSDRFGIEPELTAKLAKQHARIFEVPISYHGRTYEEGKKINLSDAFKALYVVVRYWLIDDLYGEDRIGQMYLHQLEKATHFYAWQGDVIKKYLGARVLEIGAGIGTLSARFCQRDRYIATDPDEMFAQRLAHRFAQRPNVRVAKLDPSSVADVLALDETVDTVVCLNVLENIQDDKAALMNLRHALEDNGRLVVMVPQGEELYGSIDKAIGRCRRYSRDHLIALITDAGYTIERVIPFNRIGYVGWWLNGKILARQELGRVQLKILDSLMWAVKRLDPLLPWPGLSLIVVARKS
ncbi:MAG TPA: glycosyltransferase [Aggregatilineales bacterium]|nr:glycosyltransferase [Aggregatilineales bacterium]